MNQKYDRKPLIKTMLIFSIAPLILFLVFLVLNKIYNQNIFRIFYIAFLVIFYHFSARLITGGICTYLYANKKFNYQSKWYKLSKFEKRFYKFIKIKKWKTKMITAIPSQFDIKQRSLDELLHNMNVAERVHIVSMLLSFAPLLLIIPYGTAAAFISTSVIACIGDSLFVMIQRYNRARILKKRNILEKFFSRNVRKQHFKSS